jgi:hypothetical protein
MNYRIIYPNDEGGVAVIVPSPDSGLTIEQIAEKDVPKGVPYEIVDVTEIPNDRTFRAAWEKQGKSVQHNIIKCKDIAHSKRRTKRDELFAPYDAIIAKQIPGKNTAAAEQARTDIRQADAVVQESIDSSSNIEQIKSVLLAYSAL